MECHDWDRTFSMQRQGPIGPQPLAHLTQCPSLGIGGLSCKRADQIACRNRLLLFRVALEIREASNDPYYWSILQSDRCSHWSLVRPTPGSVLLAVPTFLRPPLWWDRVGQ